MSTFLRRILPLFVLASLTLGSCTVHEHRDYGRRGHDRGRDHHRDYGYQRGRY